MKKIYSGKNGGYKNKVYYEINNGEFTIMQISSKGLFSGKSKIEYHLDKNNTVKLLSLISEENIRKTFGSEAGFLSFKDYCMNNKIDFNCTMNMVKWLKSRG